MKGIYPLLGMWWRYIGCLVLFVIYGFTRTTDLGLFIGVVTILVFIIKIYVDFMKILDLFNYFSWSKNLAKNLKKRLNWKG
jgi:FtsH-binding integral membrane protein